VCWEDVGGCATYGCKAAPIPQTPNFDHLTSSGWGDEKVCPQCETSIPSSLLVCRCGARFPWADPMNADEYQRWVSDDAKRTQLRRQLVIFFILSLFAYPAPICGAIAGIQSYRFRHLLVGEVGTYLALGYGACVIGIVYSLIFILLYVVGI